jgi:hypothetical protein
MPIAAAWSGHSTTLRWSTSSAGRASCPSGWLRSPARGAIEIRSTERLPVADWHQISLTYDGSAPRGGLNLYREGQRLECDVCTTI